MSQALQTILLIVVLSIGSAVPLYYMLRDPFARVGRTMPVPAVLYTFTETTLPSYDWRGMY